jgi:probable addiction module antidote protein
MKTQLYDAAEYLTSPVRIAAYLTEAFETGDSEFIAQAIGNAARAQGITEVAKAAGLTTENLYRTLNTGGHPEFGTVMRVLGALGVRLEARPKA